MSERVTAAAWPGRGRWDEINDRWHAGAKITDDEVGELLDELLDLALTAGLEVERLREYYEANEALHTASDIFGEQLQMYRECGGYYPSTATITRATLRFLEARRALNPAPEPTP